MRAKCRDEVQYCVLPGGGERQIGQMQQMPHLLLILSCAFRCDEIRDENHLPQAHPKMLVSDGRQRPSALADVRSRALLRNHLPTVVI
jgi:hypothetical protein